MMKNKIAIPRPRVVMNWAMTADGKTDTARRNGLSIAEGEDWSRLDALRAACDAVMVGAVTLRVEDPCLTVRDESLRAWRRARGRASSPFRVGITSVADIDPACRFVTTDPQSGIVITTSRSSSSQIAHLERAGITVMIYGRDHVDLSAALGGLWRLGVETLLVEGGGTLNASLLAAGLVDEVHLYLAPLLLGGLHAPTPVDGPDILPKLGIALRQRSVQALGAGVLITYTAGEPRSSSLVDAAGER